MLLYLHLSNIASRLMLAFLFSALPILLSNAHIIADGFRFFDCSRISPAPNHTRRKQSLCNPSSNPFVDVIQKLEQLPNNIDEITREQIVAIAEPLICGSSQEEMMELAKETSRSLFADYEPDTRMEMINNLVCFTAVFSLPNGG